MDIQIEHASLVVCHIDVTEEDELWNEFRKSRLVLMGSKDGIIRVEQRDNKSRLLEAGEWHPRYFLLLNYRKRRAMKFWKNGIWEMLIPRPPLWCQATLFGNANIASGRGLVWIASKAERARFECFEQNERGEAGRMAGTVLLDADTGVLRKVVVVERKCRLTLVLDKVEFREGETIRQDDNTLMIGWTEDEFGRTP